MVSKRWFPVCLAKGDHIPPPLLTSTLPSLFLFASSQSNLDFEPFFTSLKIPCWPGISDDGSHSRAMKVRPFGCLPWRVRRLLQLASWIIRRDAAKLSSYLRVDGGLSRSGAACYPPDEQKEHWGSKRDAFFLWFWQPETLAKPGLVGFESNSAVCSGVSCMYPLGFAEDSEKFILVVFIWRTYDWINFAGGSG